MPRYTVLIVCLAFASPAAAGSITDLTEWTQTEDPPHPNVFTVVNDPNETTLRADGAVPSGTDIGYASVNGSDVAGSTGGYYFDPGSDFQVAIDFDLSSANAAGAGGIGFGIGEDIAGTDSAGVALAILNGAPLLFTSAGRFNDVSLTPETLVAGFGRGRFFVEYQSATGDVVVGVNATPGASAPSVVESINAIQTAWDDEPLLVSFFLRSQAVNPLPGLTGGTLDVVFSNFEVLAGTPLSIPEPTTSLLAIFGALGVLAVPRHARG